jgi:toxin ParE1/3/4
MPFIPSFAQDNEHAADAMIRRIVSLAEQQISRLPESGRPGRITSTRELVVTGTPFILPYRIFGDSIHIPRVLHSARHWPDSL